MQQNRYYLKCCIKERGREGNEMALRLGDILVEKGIITPQELKMAIDEQQRTGEILGQVLVKMGFVTEKEMLQALAEQQGIPFLDLKDVKIDENVIKKVPAKFATHYKIMPLNMEENVLTIAISNPFDMWPIDDLETHLGFRVERTLATTQDILEAIGRYYGVGSETIEGILAGEPRPEKKQEVDLEDNVQDLEKMAGDASIIKLVNQILRQAIDDRATDIHIEHFRGELALRYRIDGVLYDIQVSEDIRQLHPAIVSRIKVMSGLNIIERRIPQDGRTKVKIGDNECDLRVSVVPTIYGENIVIRILHTKMLYDLSDLGLSRRAYDILDELLKKPHGIVLVTGPTGSGKSTTLYAALNKLNTRDRKIITIEDPVEYELRGITQIQVNPKIGLTFAQALRSMLRHDPDIMMVGEVRDFETAEITIQTALTGHLVFSTLHTNDAASGVTRLLNIGVEPFLIASSVVAFIAQRLVRVLCKKCKEKYEPKNSKDKTLYRARGCEACNNTGYMGRTGIYEILLVNEEIEKLILKKASASEIKEKAQKLGMKNLRDDGWEKVIAGVTTPEEVMRVTQL